MQWNKGSKEVQSCPPHHQSREMKERVWKWTFHVCLLNALRTLKFLLEVCVPQTLLYENYRCFTMEQNYQKKLRKRETFPDFFATVIRLFLAPFFTRRPALISRPYIMFLVEEQQCMGELNFWLLLAGFFLQMYDETLLLSSLNSRLDVCNPHRIFIEGACQLPSFYSILTDNNSEKCKHFWKV